LLALADDS